MESITVQPQKTTVNIRIEQTVRSLIDRAAQMSGKTRSAFILEAATRSAEDVLLDQTLFMLDKEQWNAFQDILDAPVEANISLRRLMKTSAPWE